MNLLALRTEVLAHGFDATQYSARISQYLNDAQGLACRRVSFFTDEATQDFNTVVGTTLYPQPADFGRDRSLRDTSRDVEMQSATLREIDRSSHTASGAPAWYALDAANLHLYPAPDNVYPMELRYWKLPAQMIADTDTPVIPADYHRMLVYWALKECYAGDDDIQTGAPYWEAQFNTVLAEFAADVKFPNEDAPHQLASMYEQGRGLSRGWRISGSGWE